MQEKQYKTDVLIIGAGSAGLWAAHSVKVQNPDTNVLVVDKGPENWGGLMSAAGGDLDVVMPDEKIEDWLRDWVYYYDGLCDQKLHEKLFARSYDILQQYLEWGCEYLTDENGDMETVGVKQRGLDHIKLYVTKIKGSGGLRLVNALVKAITAEGVESIGRTLITDLVKNQEGRIVGAVGFDTIDGTFITIQAKAVLLATGMGGWKSSYMSNTETAEGLEMAFRAGAELRNLEFSRVWVVPKLFGWEGQTTLLPLGARFVNARGENFMEYYTNNPKLAGNTDPHYTATGMCMEMRAGRGPIYLDTTTLQPGKDAVVMPKMGWQLINYNRLKDDCGIDFFHQKTEWMPQPLCSYGGLVTDSDGATRVPGLYAAGRCRSIDPGVYTGGFALMTTAVTGQIAGEAITEYIRNVEIEQLDSAAVEEYREKLYAPLGKPGINSKEVLRAVQRIAYAYDVCLVKSEKSLNNALHQLETLKQELVPNMSAADPHYLLKLKETEATVFITECYIRASLERKESRAGHFREDYPDHADAWLKWLICGLKDGELSFRTEDVPIDEYKIPLTEYYQDNFKYV
ncbi:MAG: FAD-binding protein [Eubacteriales bacterium]|nr:FAD-binding protein [Eubacteriales bacterium]